jgi:hypothetical protein
LADVEVIILDQTGAVTQKGFGLILVFDPTQDIPYTEISETSEIPSPLDSTDVAYKMIERILGQTIHPDIVAVYGYDMDQVGGVKTIATIMNELAIEHNEFYWPLLADRTDANIQAMAAWAAANGKFFIAGNNKGNTAPKTWPWPPQSPLKNALYMHMKEELPMRIHILMPELPDIWPHLIPKVLLLNLRLSVASRWRLIPKRIHPLCYPVMLIPILRIWVI